MKEFIEFIIKHIVDKSDEVQVSEIEGERTVLLKLRVSKYDIGTVIGRRGQNIRALETLLAAASGKLGKRFILEILK